MRLSPRFRKLVLTAHVSSSAGWTGAVLVFLGLSVIGLNHGDARIVRGTYLVMEPAAWLTLVPLAFASLVTGLISSLGTHWGLLRHYWVIFKLVINVVATIVLLIYMETFRLMAAAAGDGRTPLSLVRSSSPLLHSLLALQILLLATVLAVYKPKGMTRYGQRRQRRPV